MSDFHFIVVPQPRINVKAVIINSSRINFYTANEIRADVQNILNTFGTSQILSGVICFNLNIISFSNRYFYRRNNCHL